MKNLFRIAAFLKPYTWQVTATLAMLLLLTGLNLIVPRIIQNVIDDGLLRGDVAYLVRSALLLLGLGLVSQLPCVVVQYEFSLPDRTIRRELFFGIFSSICSCGAL